MVSVNVFLVEEVYLNDKRLEHLGVIIFHNAHGCKSLLVPQEGDPLTFNFPNNGDLKTTEREMGQFFYHKEHEAFGYIYTEKKDVNIFTAFLYDTGEECVTKGEQLIDFAKHIPTKKQPHVSNNTKDFKKFISSFKCIWPKRYFADQVRHRNYRLKPEGLREIYSDLSYHKHFYEAYVNFVIAHPAMNSKEGKKLIRSIDNIPKFAKETLRWDSYQWIYILVADFVEMHMCVKRGCGGLSFLKCSRCKIAYYCSEECQNKDFQDQHKLKCNEYIASRKLREAVPNILATLVTFTEDGYNPDPVTFDVFKGELMARVYDYFYEIMIENHEKNIHKDYAISFFTNQRFNITHSKDDIKSISDKDLVGFLGKRRKVEKFETIFNQMQETFDDAGTDADGKPFEAKLVSHSLRLSLKYLEHTTGHPTIILGRDGSHVARELGITSVQELYGTQFPE